MNKIFTKFQKENAPEEMNKASRRELMLKTKQENVERNNRLIHELVLRTNSSLTRDSFLILLDALALKIENKNTTLFLKDLFLVNPNAVRATYDYYVYESKHKKLGPTYNIKLFRTILSRFAYNFPIEEKKVTSSKSAMDMFSGINFGAKK